MMDLLYFQHWIYRNLGFRIKTTFQIILEKYTFSNLIIRKMYKYNKTKDFFFFFFLPAHEHLLSIQACIMLSALMSVYVSVTHT